MITLVPGVVVVGMEQVSSCKAYDLEAPLSKHVLKCRPAMCESLLKELSWTIQTTLFVDNVITVFPDEPELSPSQDF